jgi:hypothetical protein
LKKSWCLGTIEARFLAQMERLLWLYALPDDPLYPVICFDERPCFLIGTSVAGLEMRAGRVAREHYAYEKNGSCALLMAIEPQTGKRLARVFDQRRKCEYAQFMKELAARYPEAKKIRLVQDNVHTHSVSAFYESFSAEEAFALSRALRVLLHAEIGELVEYDRDRVLGALQAMPESADREPRGAEPGGLSGCQRARGESHQARLAILHYLSEEQVKQALSASSC